MPSQSHKKKSFWSRPEGVAGGIFLGGTTIALGYLLSSIDFYTLFQNTTNIAIACVLLASLIYMAIDPKMRNLIWYMYKSLMRWITGLFVDIDPIGILKNYIADLQDNLKKMRMQVNKLRAEMHKLQERIHNNKKNITANLEFAGKAKKLNDRTQLILSSRKAGRLKESNIKLTELYKKMEVLYRVLSKMEQNSVILLEDVKDQVAVKEQERKAITASHSAMTSAMNIIKGDKDKRAMFDQALEAIADDVSHKVGEMERFMSMSANFMDSIDLQNGVFEEEGLQMLEKWEKESDDILLLEGEKDAILNLAYDEDTLLDLNSPIAKPMRGGKGNQYDSLFE